MKKHIVYGLMPLIGLLALASCGASSTAASDGKLKIATTFAPVYDFARRIAGDKADIITIVGENEPHGFAPSDPQSVAFAENADVFFAYGWGMDDWAKSITTKNYEEITADVTQRKNGETIDPHAWLSLKDAQIMLTNIADVLKKTDSANASYYEANEQKALGDFKALDAKYAKTLAKDNISVHAVVTSHEAFGYLAQDYGFTQKGVADMADNEPSPAKLSDLMAFIKANGIHYINVEELDSAGFANTIKDQLAKENYSIEITAINAFEGVAVSDWTKDDNYLSVMEDNLSQFAKVLGAKTID